MLHKDIRGKSLHAPSNEIVENHTGSPIAKMKVVAFNGMGTLFPQIQLANPGVEVNFGITQTDILNDEAGYITCLGFMLDVNTAPWIVGTELYSDANGNLSPTPNGAIVATVIKSDATTGVLYVTGVTGTGGSGPTNPGWEIDGNTGLNESTDFLGTTDNVDLRIRTNNQFRMVIGKSGRIGFGVVIPDEFIHIKAHSNYADSGRRITTFGVQTSDTNWNTAYTWQIPDNSNAHIKVSVVGRVDASNRAALRKTITAYRDGSIATLGRMQSDFTDRTDPNFNVRFRRINSVIVLEVQSATASPTNWTGTVEIDVTGAN